MENVVSTVVQNPLVPKDTETYVVIAMHSKGLMGASQWDGPFDTLEKAQTAAARWLVQTGALAMSVFKLVGTVAKPAPDLHWHEVPKSSDSEPG